MGRRIDCPLEGFEAVYLVLPDVWLGLHAARRDQAIEQARPYKSLSLTEFGIALALLEDWGGITGLGGPPDKWDFGQVPLRLLSWISGTVLDDFGRDLHVPKGSWSPRSNGPKPTPATAIAPTSSEAKG